MLLDIGRILTGTLEADELYRTIYEQASRVLETTGFYISLYDEERDRATVVFYADRGEIGRPGTTYRGSESRAIREARPVLEELEAPERAIMLLGADSDEEVTRSVMAAPLLHEGNVLGVISAQSYRSAAYTADDLELLLAISDLAGVAVSNARTVQELERQRRESEQLESIARALASSLELTEVLERIVGATQNLVSADGAGVWLLRPDMRAEVAMTAGELALPTGTTIPVPEALYRTMARDRRPVMFDHSEHNALIPDEIRRLVRAESGIAVPLLLESELIGALSVSHGTAREYLADDVRLLERFAVHAALAVSNARLHEQVRFLSLTDPLTELPNRRHMQIFLEKEFAAAERGRALTVILYDLDDFKVFNDAQGHQAGDRVLRAFGRALAGETRAMNLAARYGGDEFISILSDTDYEGGAMHIGRVLKAMRRHPDLAPLAVSAGIASYETGMASPEDLIRRADESLYVAKSSRGRGIPTP
ncbi:MAG: sensor domain-containing diguanylate cyclase [Gemmatimonadetes bacterium]|nr:sensor domain-containing diguanylate cyclase [Gemmatimonadota bacterium]